MNTNIEFHGGAGRKHFGLTWTMEGSVWEYAGKSEGSFAWVASEEDYSGNVYRVDHLPDGTFLLSEESGTYMNPHQRDIATFATPLDAMMQAAQMYRDDEREGAIMERMIDEALAAADAAMESGIYDT
jgi:hypothetical protein